MDRALSRKHKYENLTMLFNTPQALALLRSNGLNESPAISKSGNTFTTPVRDGFTSGIDTPAEPDPTQSEQQKLCLSPRFPPDGAAFYEMSPPSSSVSTSPVTNTNPDLKSTVPPPTTIVDTPSVTVPSKNSCGSEVVWNGQTNAVNDTMDSASVKNCGPALPSAFGFLPFDTKHVRDPSEPGDAVESLPTDRQCSAPSLNSDTPASSAPVEGTNQSDWFPPAPPPPLHTVWASATDSDVSPRYHEHCRPGEERRFHGFEAGGSNKDRTTLIVSSTAPVLESVISSASGIATQAPSLSHKSRTLSSPTPPPLPPPPSPPSPPAVPRRDPRTTLHQARKHVADSESRTETVPFCTAPTIGHDEPITNPASSNPHPDAMTPSIRPMAKDSVPTPATIASATAKNANITERTQNRSVHNPTPTKSSASRPMDDPPSPVKPITRPIPVKGSPLTDVPVEYHRHNSLPASTTLILDGRSVVPWNPTSRDLLPAGAVNAKSNVEAAVAAALTQSIAYSADSPQWVPPKQVNPALNGGALNSAADYANTVSAYGGIQSVETGTPLDSTSEIFTNVRRNTATRPNCLPGVVSYTDDRSGQAERRHVSTSVQSGKREPHRRMRTSSDMVDAFQSVGDTAGPELGQPIVAPSDGNRLTHAVQSGKNPFPAAEAEWWRAHQRSGLLSHGHTKTQNAPELFKRQVSAGPAFTLASTGQTQLSPTRLWSSQAPHTRSRDVVHLIGRTQASPTENTRAIMTQSSTRGQFNEDVVLVDGHPDVPFESHVATQRLNYFRSGVPLSPEHPQRFFSDPRFVSMDQSQVTTAADRVRSTKLHESFELDHRDRMIREANSGYHSSSMTQSVFFPPDSGWTASTHIPYEIHKSAAPPSSSGRRRRVRQGVMRSQSQRNTDPFDASRHSTTETMSELQGFCLPANFYQRSISHTVPLEATGLETAWPPVMAQWHHRRTTTGDPTVFAAQLSDARAVASRRDRALRAGRSSNDLIHPSRTNHQHPQHHHSASAIYERLEEQPWFHFDLSRAGAERLLKSTPVGSFLVRQSETSKSEYSLSIRRECDFLHMKISQDPNSNQYVLGEYSQPYPTISAMIYRYMQSLLPVRGTTPVLLRFPVCRKTPKSRQGLD